MEQSLTLDGKAYALIREQRNGLRLYRGEDSYVRVGPADRIERDITSHRAMAKAGYPVAAILSEGDLNGERYFVEQSLGEKTFRTLFEEDITTHRTISDERFNEFFRISKRFLQAQAQAVVPASPEAFASAIHLEMIREELPQYTISLGQKFERVCERLAKFPYVLSHGDFNASNMLPLGVIDLEDVSSAPFGFDAVCPMATLDWFPDGQEFEFFARYRFSDSQRSSYLTMIDALSQEAGFPAITPYYDDLAFCRAVWSCVRMQAYPKLQKWRYDKFIKTYLFY